MRDVLVVGLSLSDEREKVYHVDGLQKYFRKAGLHQSACQSHRVLDNIVNMSHPNATMRERVRKGNWETHRVFDGC